MSPPSLFHRLLVANRGEVAVRIARACDALGVEPVFAYSEADRDAPYLAGRRRVCLGPGRASESYLDPRRLVQAAKNTDCSALHPGWGFLSENAAFASLCEAHGVTFIGPPAHVMHLMGTKSPAKRAMREAGLRVIPGSDGPVTSDEQARAVAEEIGLPLLIKAESGGGGRGMKIVRDLDQLSQALADARREGLAFFGDPSVYIERLLEGGRHIEIQVMADRYGNVCHLGERDCTIQRNHQKLIEESPSPALDPEERERTLALAVQATRQIGYVGAGTLEFLLDTSGDAPVLRFMEMNTRLQVEHSVSEVRSGVDLVTEQIAVAAGRPLSFSQQDVTLSGHVIECRINAEDPADGFRPCPGRIERWVTPRTGDGRIRVDTHVTSGYTIPPHYDSLICKLIASGPTREAATQRMLEALAELEAEGIRTTQPLHQAILSSEDFRANRYDTTRLPTFTLSAS
ncbi:MAG: ATP-grasp domain-containing protein [Polyangiaceae bacterium]|nr:ATP-grasp domain-containing protein [Polyangiaceae bacterium]MCW5791736.1 ATP-grasp domain-containing protein [Polyangiaceae bacterium]